MMSVGECGSGDGHVLHSPPGEGAMSSIPQGSGVIFSILQGGRDRVLHSPQGVVFLFSCLAIPCFCT